MRCIDAYSLSRRLINYYQERDNLGNRVQDIKVAPDNWRSYCQARRLHDLEERLIPELETHLQVIQYHVRGSLPYAD